MHELNETFTTGLFQHNDNFETLESDMLVSHLVEIKGLIAYGKNEEKRIKDFLIAHAEKNRKYRDVFNNDNSAYAELVMAERPDTVKIPTRDKHGKPVAKGVSAATIVRWLADEGYVSQELAKALIYVSKPALKLIAKAAQ